MNNHLAIVYNISLCISSCQYFAFFFQARGKIPIGSYFLVKTGTILNYSRSMVQIVIHPVGQNIVSCNNSRLCLTLSKDTSGCSESTYQLFTKFTLPSHRTVDLKQAPRAEANADKIIEIFESCRIEKTFHLPR